MSELDHTNGANTALVPFAYGDAAVRVVVIDGDPWFVLADLCKVLGMARGASQITDRLDDGVRQTYPISDSLGRTQQATIVSESGMYEVVIRSDKPEAVKFRRWITGEVLPAIRKTGSYSLDAQVPKTLPEALRAYAREVEAREAAEAYARELEPKAEYVDDFVSPDDCLTFRTLANQINMKETELRELLVEKKRIYRKFIGRRFSRKAGKLVDEYEWRAYADWKHHFRLIPQHNAPRHHNNQVRQTLYVTPPGAQAIRKLAGVLV
ncbi:anti-repressor Ant [Mycobacterium phage Firehouse51]|uniref:Antirepressor n=1 Tax=Mycobacterium phage Firehouse51 TaxID=2776877 RepID=A0A7M1CNU1_9CAUD|nr:anti-repressor Ant [Mycobacterium phage Firehouse51]QOP65009.1 antirepressor [Mycobacterium phage Firehouse51]